MADDIGGRGSAEATPASGGGALVALAWLVVLVPLLWGVTQTLVKSVALFK
jgi:hypothetical protein